MGWGSTINALCPNRPLSITFQPNKDNYRLWLWPGCNRPRPFPASPHPHKRLFFSLLLPFPNSICIGKALLTPSPLLVFLSCLTHQWPLQTQKISPPKTLNFLNNPTSTPNTYSDYSHPLVVASHTHSTTMPLISLLLLLPFLFLTPSLSQTPPKGTYNWWQTRFFFYNYSLVVYYLKVIVLHQWLISEKFM